MNSNDPGETLATANVISATFCRTVFQVLLIANVLVARDQDLAARLFGARDQLAI